MSLTEVITDIKNLYQNNGGSLEVTKSLILASIKHNLPKFSRDFPLENQKIDLSVLKTDVLIVLPVNLIRVRIGELYRARFNRELPASHPMVNKHWVIRDSKKGVITVPLLQTTNNNAAGIPKNINPMAGNYQRGYGYGGFGFNGTIGSMGNIGGNNGNGVILSSGSGYFGNGINGGNGFNGNSSFQNTSDQLNLYSKIEMTNYINGAPAIAIGNPEKASNSNRTDYTVVDFTYDIVHSISDAITDPEPVEAVNTIPLGIRDTFNVYIIKQIINGVIGSLTFREGTERKVEALEKEIIRIEESIKDDKKEDGCLGTAI